MPRCSPHPSSNNARNVSLLERKWELKKKLTRNYVIKEFRKKKKTLKFKAPFN